MLSYKTCSLALLGALLILTAVNSQANEACFASIREQAIDAGVAADTVERVMAHAKIEPKIVALDRKQPEFSTTFADYMGKRVNETRIEKGRALRQTHSRLLAELTRKYGVPGHYLLAFWGLETNFGGYMGKKNAPSALATLACDGRRASFFTAELIETMRLVEKYKLDPAKMESSWAGAMGQTQFMPSTFARYAVDGDNDGKVDLWNSTADALASGANYLKALDWQTRRRWGREVLLPAGFEWSVTGRKASKKTLAQWRALGVRTAAGHQLPDVSDIEAAIIAPAGHKGPAFIIYKNFNVIMGWNRSEYYALSVGHLADRIAGAGELRRAPPTDKGLRRLEVKAIQQSLNELGFDAGKPDGIIGSATRRAVRAYQLQNKMIADGYPDEELFRRLKS
ncbi:MAG: lytic murein transglycosylase [Pseudomonadales bacterium]